MFLEVARRAIFSLALIVIPATASALDKIDAAAGPPDNGDAYFLIGVGPSDTRLTVEGGTMKNNIWYSPDGSWISDASDGGFIFGKIRGDTPQAITQAYFYADKTEKTGAEKATRDIFRLALGLTPSFLGRKFCFEDSSVEFQVPAGKIMYITSVNYTYVPGSIPRWDRLEPTFSSDLTGARKFLSSHYPQLENLLEQGTYQIMRTGVICP
jgi:hypothetical protein